MSNVSLYKNNRDTQGYKPATVSLIYKCIKSGHWDKFVQPVRRLEYGSDAYKAAKNNLPAFTMSGTFPKGKRNNEDLIAHSGRIAIDIDGLKDGVEDARQQLITDEYSEGLGLSVGGRGLVVFVKIDGAYHEQIFEQLERYYLELYGLQIDKSCKNVARIRYVTSDPDFYHNPEASTFEYVEPSQKVADFDAASGDGFLTNNYTAPSTGFEAQAKRTVAEEIIRRSVQMINDAGRGEVHHAIMKASELGGGYISGGLVDETDFKNAVLSAILQKPKALSRKLEEKKVDDGIRHGKTKPIRELMVDKSKAKTSVRKFKDYGINWNKISELEKEAFKEVIALAHEKNRAGDKLDTSFLKQFAEMQKLPVDKVTEVYSKVYELNAAYFNFDNLAHVQKAEVHINENWELRYNTVKNTVDYRAVGANGFRELKIENIYRNLQHNRIKYSMADLKSLLNSDFVKQYDPIDNYFSSLHEWDKIDHIKALSNHIKVERQDFFNSMFKKHLVRAVRCGLGRGVNRYVFTIVGEKQSTGKSYFLRWLCPFESDYYTEVSIATAEKDLKIAAAKNFIHNIDELGGISKKNIEALKSLISIDKISERLPYGATAVTMKRRVNYFASTNKKGVLTDTENTRWLMFNLLGIDRKYSKEINVNDIWAQAYALYKDDNFSDQLSKEEEDMQEGTNKSFNAESPEEEAIKAHFKVCQRGEGDFYSVFDVTVQLNETYPALRLNVIGVGRAMKNIGFEEGRKTINGHRQRGYYAKRNLGTYKEDTGQQKAF